MNKLPLWVLGVGLIFSVCGYADEDEPKGGPPEFKHLKYRSIGPAAGGRVCRSVGVPGDPLIYYAATASGGVWKSSNGGLGWKPIFDDQPISTIGAIAVAPSDPNVIYVGTGEANPRGNVAVGNGIYRSTDAGKTWQHVWKQEGQIGKMVVHPTDPQIAYAAVLGHAFGPNPERGVYRTIDGGKSWQRVLFKDALTGASDVSLDPNNPRIIFAGFWQMRRRPWEMTSGGPGSGLYISRDGGDTWKKLGPNPPAGAKEPEDKPSGLPEGIWGKIGVAVAPSDSRRVYALIEAEKGGLYRSDNGGEKWQRINGGHFLSQRAWYYSTLTIDPANADVVYFPQVRLLRTIDGGKTITMVKGLHHPDHHDLWIDPKNSKRMIDSNDGGVDITTNGGETWHAPPLPISQFYHVATDNAVPYRVSGCMQDLGTACGPSNSLSGGGIALADWFEVGGGEAGFTAHDPADPDIIYAGEYGGFITRYDHRLKQARNVSIYPTNASGHGGEDLKFRFQWTAPILVSEFDSKTVYHGANVLFRSSDSGQNWKAISPDLTRNDKSKQKWSGGPLTGDNTGVEIYGTIFALAESPKSPDTVWAGSDDGLVHVTTDGGKNWTNVTKNIAGFPEWGTVACIELSPFEAQTAYLVVDAHRLDDMKPYLFKTEDQGKTWKSLASSLPQDVNLHAVRVDPKKKGLLYLATERGVMFSLDDGASWRELKLNLPAVPVHDLKVKGNDLVVGTHGRSIWIFDDLTPIREYTASIGALSVHLFPILSTPRYRFHGSYAGKGQGANPPGGAVIRYCLKEKPAKPITLEIHDAKGNLVIKLTSEEEKDDEPENDPDGREEKKEKKALKTDIGVNQAVWDLRYKGARKIMKAKVDAGDPETGPLALPGKYKATLHVGDKTATQGLIISPQPLEALVVESPRVDSHEIKHNYSGLASFTSVKRHLFTAPDETTLSSYQKQLDLTLAIRDDLSRLATAVHTLQSIRKQIIDRNELLKDDPKAESLIKDSKALLAKIDALENKFHNPKAEVTYDILAQKGGAQLYSKLSFLYESIKDSDAAPPQGIVEEYAEQLKELNQLLSAWRHLLDQDMAKLNEDAKKLEVPTLLAPVKKAQD